MRPIRPITIRMYAPFCAMRFSGARSEFERLSLQPPKFVVYSRH
jgi:hypothetical protein